MRQVLIWLELEKSCNRRHIVGLTPISSSTWRASARLGKSSCLCEVMVGTGGRGELECDGSGGEAMEF